MNILITGGTGMVGSELGKALAAKGHNLFVLTRSKEKAQLTCPFPQTPLNYDELDSHPCLESLDFVINLAGANLFDKRWNAEHKRKIYDSRVKTTRQLVDLCNLKCPKLKAFISTSAVGIYGDTGTEVVSEDHSLSYSFLGKVCQDWEAPLAVLRPEIRDVILRLGIVFSERGGAIPEMVTPLQSGVGGALASGKQFMSWIDIDDLVAMFVFAVETPLRGIYNAVAPNPETNQEITLAIAEQLNVKPLMKVPYFALRAVMGEMAKHIVENQKISSTKIQNKGFQFQYKKASSSIQKRVPPLKGMQRRKIFEQWVPKKKEEIFPFFSDAHNLEQITPQNLQFQVTGVSTKEVEEGTIIDYKLKISGIPLRWKTLIMKWNPPHSFMDNQEKGPYKKWLHLHKFEDLAGGTLMTDQVDIELPLGVVGFGAASWKVLSDVDEIFNHRRKIIFDLFGNDESQSPSEGIDNKTNPEPAQV